MVVRLPSEELVSDLIGMPRVSSIHINVSVLLTLPGPEVLTITRYLMELRPFSGSAPSF